MAEDEEKKEKALPARRGPDEAMELSGVKLKLVGRTDLSVLREFGADLRVECKFTGKTCRVCFFESDDDDSKVLECTVSDCTHLYRGGPSMVFLRLPEGSAILNTHSQSDASKLLAFMEGSLPSEGKHSQLSRFNIRTEDSSAKQYFQFYGYLSQQQNMLQDYVRTGTYQSAMLQNTADFKGKVVLDVGAGTGVLSFFALQAGARKVYAVEASNMAVHCQRLVKENHFSDRMTVIAGKVEEVEVPEEVDMIISEPMGYMLFNERMLETYLHAKKWLKPGGNMFPTKGILYAAPFTDEGLYLEQFSKAHFWTQNSFHGIDVSSLRQEAVEEYFKQPVLDTFDVRIVMAKPVGHTTDFLKANEQDLVNIEIPLQYKMWSTGMVHGLAFWFDCVFSGSESSVWLSTAPFQPLTHWYQIRLLLPKPIFIHKDQEMAGHLSLVANERQSYDVTVKLSVPGSAIKSESSYDLKNPNFRYMTTPLSVPGAIHTPPTEGYFEDSFAQHNPGSVTNTPSSSSTSSSSSSSSSFSSSSMNNSNQSSHPLSPPNGPTPPPPSSSSSSSSSYHHHPPYHSPPQGFLNPAAPQFVPLPSSSGGLQNHTHNNHAHNHHHHHHHTGNVSRSGGGGGASSNGLLVTPTTMSGGFHMSPAMYSMGAGHHQMAYTQSHHQHQHAELGGPVMMVGGAAAGHHGKHQGSPHGGQQQQQQANFAPYFSRQHSKATNNYYY